MSKRAVVWFAASLVLALVVSLGFGAGPARADGLDDLVNRFYQDVLDRTPEPDGAASWSAFLRASCNAAGFDTLARNFFGSNEFVQTKSLTNVQLVAKFYRALLNRTPEPAGTAAWANVLRQARLQMALSGFVPSAEFRGLLPDRTNATAVATVVNRLYTEILNRAPDPVGAAGWVSFITQTGNLEAVAQGFLTSAEFEARALTFPAYVTILYRTFLGRQPDAAGLNGWVRILTETMLLVINAGFVPSPEFQGLSAALCPSVMPTIIGVYSGPISETLTMCADAGSDFGTLNVNVNNQSGSAFSGSASANFDGVITSFTTFAGSVNGSGGVAGSFSFSGVGFSGQGTFSGSVVGKTMSGSIAGKYNPPVNCLFTGSFSVTRP